MIITDRDMKQQIVESLGAEGTTEWAERVYDKIHEVHGLIDIDDLPTIGYWEIVAESDPCTT